MINLTAADGFLKSLEEKDPHKKAEIEKEIRDVELALDKLRESFGGLKGKIKSAGIGDDDFREIQKEIRDKVSGHEILGI